MTAELLEEITEEHLQQMLDETRGEYIHGEVVEKTMGAESEYIGSRLLSILFAFVDDHRLGRVFGSQTGYRCFPNERKRIRKPDVSFIAASRPESAELPQGDWTIAPDLAVEIISPHDKYVEIEEKVADYRLAGVKLIWIVNPSTKSIVIRRLDRTCAEIDGDATLEGEDVVPGFTLPLARLFEKL